MIGIIMAIRTAINQLKKEIKCTVSTSKAELELHGQNETGLPAAPPDAVLYPESTQQVSQIMNCLLYTSPSPRDRQKSRMPSSA